VPTEKRGFQISYSDFWRLYLKAHRKPATRGMHYFATFVGVAGTAAAIFFEEALLMPAGIAAGYGIAIGSHRFIEGNQPLIKVNPLYGAFCDLRMLWYAVTGRLAAEYRRLDL
jgi:hypothetical protein